MTTMIPNLSEAQLSDLPSQAEAKLYRAIRDQLPQELLFFFKLVGYCGVRMSKQGMVKQTF